MSLVEKIRTLPFEEQERWADFLLYFLTRNDYALAIKAERAKIQSFENRRHLKPPAVLKLQFEQQKLISKNRRLVREIRGNYSVVIHVVDQETLYVTYVKAKIPNTPNNLYDLALLETDRAGVEHFIFDTKATAAVQKIILD